MSDDNSAAQIPTAPSSPIAAPPKLSIISPLTNNTSTVPKLSLGLTMRRTKDKGVAIGDPAAPNVWKDFAPGAGPATTDANPGISTPSSTSTEVGQSPRSTVTATSANSGTQDNSPPPSAPNNGALAAGHVTTNADSTTNSGTWASQPGPPTGAFDATNFMANAGCIANGGTLPSLSVPSAAPSGKRSMRKQSDRSFTTKTGGTLSKKKKNLTDATDTIPGWFSEEDMECYDHIGMEVPADDSAAKYRERTTKNESKFAIYATTLERTVNANKKLADDRLHDLGLILRDTKTSLTSILPLGENPLFVDVHNAVADNRTGIQRLFDVVPPADFWPKLQEWMEYMPSSELFERIQSVPRELDAMRNELDAINKRFMAMGSGAASNSAFLTPSAPETNTVTGAVVMRQLGGTTAPGRPAFTPLSIPTEIRYQMVSNTGNRNDNLPSQASTCPAGTQAAPGMSVANNTTFASIASPNENHVYQSVSNVQ
ncbi:hypothetical protein DFH07DRAFT_773590 [Mycena maculata]|uniref:Uncharacterized protein n=1 Tax=Mycena maculata TaxID=230809 RepID=A0AAD7J339_9AGAR|nr:hypothetical protein DFH07DRAFT_773590 [Mycena maculata]